jgi:hypothetical protein
LFGRSAQGSGGGSDAQAVLSHCITCHEQGVVPEEVKAQRGLIHIDDPRDAVFLSAAE